MTQEEDILLKDLCARLPYQVKINCFDVPRTLESISIDCDIFVTIDCGGEHFRHPLSYLLHKDCLPYLRPMSSMTEEEIKIYHSYCECDDGDFTGETLYFDTIESFDYLNSIHVDYRGLIPMGLAIEAPEGMYK